MGTETTVSSSARVEKVDSPIGDENLSRCNAMFHHPVEKVDSPIGDENDLTL